MRDENFNFLNFLMFCRYIKLCTQEIGNIFRKSAFHALVSDVKSSSGHASDGRLNRFSNQLLRDAIVEFREPIGFPVPSVVPVPKLVVESLREAAASKTVKPLTAEDEARVLEVLERVQSSAGAMQDTGDAGVASEVIHEQVCPFSASKAILFLLQMMTHETGSRS